MFSALSKAGGKAFSNMAVGYNNVDVNAANKYGVAVGNTPVSFLFYLLKCLIQILQKVKLNEPSPVSFSFPRIHSSYWPWVSK